MRDEFAMQQNWAEQIRSGGPDAMFDEDYSGSFSRLRGSVTDSHGVRLVDYVRGLRPTYRRVYRDLAIGAVGLITAAGMTIAGQAAGLPWGAVVAGGAALIGFWFFYLVSFLHEGLHWNLAPHRAVNDVITGTLLACMLGLDLESRRRQHFEHHRFLGTTRDTEMMYFWPLDLRALMKSASGLGAVRALVWYARRAIRRPETQARAEAPARQRATAVYLAIGAGAATHAAVVSSLWISGGHAAALAWVLGVASVMPVLNTVRQLLEHRHPRARADVNYARENQGACTRMFSRSWIDTIFGPAGGNQHLLHHWEAQVSYTRLADLERFLANTPLARILDQRRTTYGRALRTLFLR